MPLFSIPLSGLDAFQEALGVIANNLSNMSTTGYKDQSINFHDLFYQAIGTNGAGSAIEVGAGTTIASTDSNFNNGNLNTTGKATDVAISNEGFFVTQLNGQTEYTRAGNFALDNNGYLKTQDGQFVMGYPATNGVVGNGVLSSLQIGQGTVAPATATTSLQLNANLSANAQAAPAWQASTAYALGDQVFDGTNWQKCTTAGTTGAAKPAWNAAVSGTTADGAGTLVWTNLGPTAGNNTNDSYSTPVAVYDSQGNSHTVTFAFTKSGTNTWSYSATIPAADVTGAANPVSLGSGTFTFDANGNLLTVQPTAAGAPTTVSATNNTLPGGLLLPPGMTLADGATGLSMSWSLLDSANNQLFTQNANASGTSATSQNGFASGSLKSFAVQSDGTVEGSFTNGQTIALGQIALARFGDNQGLLRVGDNNYQSTYASGGAVTGKPGTGGLGTLTGGALELSNVDMATEFSKMISAQRGFEANAKVITSFDEVTQDTINLKR